MARSKDSDKDADGNAPLSAMAMRFVEEYCVDGDGKAAAIRAGYSSKTASSIASGMLADPRVQRAVASRQEFFNDATKIDTEFVRRNLTEVLHRCLQAKPVVEWNKMLGRYEETGEWQFDSSGANKALELLGKIVGSFKQDAANQKPLEDMTSEELLALANELKKRRDQGKIDVQRRLATRPPADKPA